MSSPSVDKPSKSKKVSAPKTAFSHPPYLQMITEAIVSLKERTGSSHYAIAKHIDEEQKIKQLPGNFKKQLSVQLKKFVASGKLVMVKKSFKLPPRTSAKSKSTLTETAVERKAKKPAATASAKPKAAAKTVVKEGKTKSLKVIKSPMKKKKAAPAVAKAKKPKSIKSPAKKVGATVAKKAKK